MKLTEIESVERDYMKKSIIFSAICSMFLMSGCTKNSQQISYEITRDECTTGKQSFSSEKDYCKALLNEKLNQNCGKKSRMETYNKRCK